jgi:hypothetical protein
VSDGKKYPGFWKQGSAASFPFLSIVSRPSAVQTIKEKWRKRKAQRKKNGIDT